MAKKKQESTSQARIIDLPNPMPDRRTINVNKADNGGYVIEHSGVSGGKYFSKTHIAHSEKHLKEMVGKMAC